MSMFNVSDRTFGLFILIVFAGMLLFKPAANFYDDMTTPQPWFSAEFDVPNYTEGQNPPVTYRLSVNRPVYGLWTVSIYRHVEDGNLALACTGGGHAAYHKDANGVTAMPFNRFIATPCSLAEGQYHACSTYHLEDERGVERTFGPFCDSFEVQ